MYQVLTGVILQYTPSAKSAKVLFTQKIFTLIKKNYKKTARLLHVIEQPLFLLLVIQREKRGLEPEDMSQKCMIYWERKRYRFGFIVMQPRPPKMPLKNIPKTFFLTRQSRQNKKQTQSKNRPEIHYGVTRLFGFTSKQLPTLFLLWRLHTFLLIFAQQMSKYTFFHLIGHLQGREVC